MGSDTQVAATGVHFLGRKMNSWYLSSVQFNHSVVSDSLWPHEPQHARPPCPSPMPWVYSNSCHRVGDTIQPSHPLSSPSPALNLSQNLGLFKIVSSSHQVAKVLELQLQHQSFEVPTLGFCKSRFCFAFWPPIIFHQWWPLEGAQKASSFLLSSGSYRCCLSNDVPPWDRQLASVSYFISVFFKLTWMVHS